MSWLQTLFGGRSSRTLRGTSSFSSRDPRCSVCESRLRPTNGLAAQLHGGHFAGSVCMRCLKVYCPRCLTKLDKCPECGGYAQSAFGKNLDELARALKTPGDRSNDKFGSFEYVVYFVYGNDSTAARNCFE